MNWQELQQLDKLDLFDFISKAELDMYINSVDINRFITNYAIYSDEVYGSFLTQYAFDNQVIEEYLKQELLKYVKRGVWVKILNSKHIITSSNNMYLNSVSDLYTHEKAAYNTYLIEQKTLPEEDIESKKTKRTKKDTECLLNTIYHEGIELPDTKGKQQSLSNYSMTEQSHVDKWLSERIGCITGSKLEALLPCGVDYSTAKSKDTALKYLIKLARERKNNKPIEDNDDFTPYAAKRGIAREQLSRQAYEKQYNVCVFEVGFLKSPIVDGLGCSLDGVVLRVDNENNIVIDHIIEVKNFIDHLKLYKILALEDYTDVYKQIQYNLLLTNAPKVVLIVDTAVGGSTNIQTFDFVLDYNYMSTELFPQILWNLGQIENIRNKIYEVEGL